MEVTSAARSTSGGPVIEPEHANLAKAFQATAEKRADEVAIRAPGDYSITWGDLRKRVATIAGGLASLGVGKGDTVAIMLNNRPEFIPIDMAVVTLGGVPFSIYQTSSPEQIEYVVADAGAKVAVIEEAFAEVFAKAQENLPNVEHVISIDGPSGTTTLEELEAVDPDFDDASAADVPGLDDELTLIYTSGTTGPPKGVQLTHRNLMGLVAGLEPYISSEDIDGGRVISWLPAAHIAERGANYYLPVVEGLEITICPDPRQIIEVLPQVHPTFFFAVPRIWEKLKAGLEAKLGAIPGEQGEQTKQALEAAIQKIRLEQAGEDVPEQLAEAVAKADEALFSHLRASLGLDQLVSVNVGAAPTPLEVLEFFHAIGIPIGELWGMSETCGASTINPPGEVKLGTVGVPVPGIDIRLAEDGEVLIKGPMIMTGYRNQPEKTAETIDPDGWLATGDIGEIDDDGYLKIIDRKKELIINAAGKNMSPANIESHLKSASPLIGQCVTIGDARSYNVALIVLDPEYAPAWASQQGIEADGVEALAENEQVRAAVQEAVETANAKLSRVEQIKKFKLLPEEWMPGGDELTPTMKLKRKPISEKYKEEIEALYA